MSVRWMYGCDTDPVDLPSFGYGGANNLAVGTDAFGDGSTIYWHLGWPNTNAWCRSQFLPTGSGIVEGGVRFWCYMNNHTMTFRLYDGNVQMVQVFWNTNRYWNITVGPQSEVTDQGVTQYQTSTWHYYDILWKIDNATGSFALYKDDELQYSVSGVDTDPASANGEVNQFYLTGAYASDYNFDDIFFWENDASGITARPERGHRIWRVAPASDGATTQWTPQGAGSHYVELDEYGSDDGDTTRISSTATGNKDLIGVGSYPGNPGDLISAVSATALARTMTGGGLKIGLRNNSIEETSTIELPVAYRRFTHIAELNPGDSSAWQASDIAATELVFQHDT